MGFFSSKRCHVDRLLADPAGHAVMVKWFGKDREQLRWQGACNHREVEMPYVQQLLDAYSQREAQELKDHEAVKDHAEFGVHLANAGERFFDADAFSRFYRDNTMSEEIDVLNNDMLHGVIDVHGGKHDDSLSRCDAVNGASRERSAIWRVVTVCARSRQAGNLPSFREYRSASVAKEVTGTSDERPPELFNSPWRPAWGRRGS